MDNYLVDIPVLLIFFNNPDRLSQVFNQIKRAKPSKLFLYQDGPRVGQNDECGIYECRKIVENIEWECDVYKWYQEKNVGCDPSEFLSQKWAFSFVDKCVILEDDDVPSVSFFSFCKDLLEKYENDQRIYMIAGMNHEEVTKDIPYDYFFTTNVSIWGWATWKRVIDQWDEKYTFMKDADIVKALKNTIYETEYRDDFFPMLQWHSNTGVQYYESILMSNMLLQSGLSIVPTKNMITNIGWNNGTHSNRKFQELPAKLKKLYTLNRYELSRKLVSPPFICENYSYKKRVYRMMGWTSEKERYLLLDEKRNNILKKIIKKILLWKTK